MTVALNDAVQRKELNLQLKQRRIMVQVEEGEAAAPSPMKMMETMGEEVTLTRQ